ncbi:MAG TPA: LysM peptidoglycan-binding domain-containing protein [Firmicutes bacterium]|nr:LysM peptidoglycan-binding domain-containing protein [Bacillota bacterium]
MPRKVRRSCCLTIVCIALCLVISAGEAAKAAHFGYRNLHVGDSGEDVDNLQRLLGEFGYYEGMYSGKLDQSTAEAVKRFQEDNGLKPDGIVRGETMRLLEKLWEGYSLVVDGYELKAGETVEAVAQNWRVPAALLRKLNGLEPGASVNAGEKLKIPVPGFVLYRVKKGDTLSGIARKYGVTVEELIRWNQIADSNMILAGEPLLIFSEDYGEGSFEGAQTCSDKNGD